MRQMSHDEFYDLLATYISMVARTVDLSDPDTIVFTPEFDDLIRHIQSKPNQKIKMTYFRQSPAVKVLYRQFENLMNKKDTTRIM